MSGTKPIFQSYQALKGQEVKNVGNNRQEMDESQQVNMDHSDQNDLSLNYMKSTI